MTYSLDFRRRVLALKEQEHLSYEETASRFRVGVASLIRWNSRIEPKATRDRLTTKIDMKALADDVKTNPDSYQYERAERFRVSQSSINKALKRLGISCKKTLSHPKADDDKRKLFINHIEEHDKLGREKVFIDESEDRVSLPQCLVPP